MDDKHGEETAVKIFDAHAHLGYDVVFDVGNTEETLLNTCARYGVDGALVQPFLPRPYIEDTRAIHDRIAAFCRAHPGRFYGMASICPHLYPDVVAAECGRCVRELGFRGVKIATTAHGVNPSGKSGMHIFEIADSLGVPVMIHTGGGSFGAPHLLEKPARAFPRVPLVIAHGGGEDGVDEAIRLAKTYDNVYVEPSWINLLGIEKLYHSLGADKLMFSSDMPQNTPAALAIFRAVVRGGRDLDKVLGETAMAVFAIPSDGL